MALKSIRVLELAGLAPAPLCGMLLADLGASVIRIDQPGSPTFPVCRSKRGKRALSLNIKTDAGRGIMEKLIKSHDVLIDPYRPGVLERMQLAPESLLERVNNRLVVARLSSFGQTGILADKPGHDINFLAVSGVLSQLTCNKTPAPPLNLVGDFAGGGLLAAFSILAALLERQSSGEGQILDLSIAEGVSYTCSWLWRSRDLPVWEHSSDAEPACWFDGKTKPFYRTYKCSDGRFIAVGCVETKFFANLLRHLKIDASHTNDNILTAELQTVFLTKTLDEWMAELKDCDTCVSPVEDLDTAPFHPHNNVRAAFMSGQYGPEPAPAPRFSRIGHGDLNVKEPQSVGQHSVEILRECGISQENIDQYLKEGIISS